LVVDRDQLARLQSLAKLHLEEASVEEMLRDMSAMLDYVSCLEELDAGETGEPGRGKPPGRDDTPSRAAAPGEATRDSAEAGGGYFRVPKVI
jgi:aspartyl/glutamyl-tRNA(Asn/Gln) amidotransferase C subunit